MIVAYERPFSHAAHWARRLALFAMLLFAVAALSHRFGPLTTPHFLLFSAISTALALVAVALAGLGFVRLWQVGAKGGYAAFTALVLAAVPLTAAGMGAAAYFTRPALYDVTTDTLAPPPWLVRPQARQDWLKRAGTVTPQDREAQMIAYPGLTGRRYDGALDRVYQGARKVGVETGIAFSKESGLENIMADLEDLVIDPKAQASEDGDPGAVPIPLSRPSRNALEPPTGRSSDVLMQGEWRTPVFGFRFDVVIRLREEAETTLVDLRVASRYGPHDLGLGAAFADRYLRSLDAELLGISGD